LLGNTFVVGFAVESGWFVFVFWGVLPKPIGRWDIRRFAEALLKVVSPKLNDKHWQSWWFITPLKREGIAPQFFYTEPGINAGAKILS